MVSLLMNLGIINLDFIKLEIRNLDVLSGKYTCSNRFKRLTVLIIRFRIYL